MNHSSSPSIFDSSSHFASKDSSRILGKRLVVSGTGCLRKKNNPSKRFLFYKVANIISVKMLHIWKVHFVSYPMPKKSFQYNTYLWSYGQNEISTCFPFWPRNYMFILKLIEYYWAALPSTWFPWFWMDVCVLVNGNHCCHSIPNHSGSTLCLQGKQ